MGTLELKSNIHKIVDRIQSEQLLRTIYDFLKVRETSKSGNIWNSLTEQQKEEVLMAFDESENENNLIDSEKLLKRGK